MGRGEGRLVSRGHSPLTISGQRLLKGSFRGAQAEKGLHVKITQSALTVVFKLIMPWSDGVISAVLSTVNP